MKTKMTVAEISAICAEARKIQPEIAKHYDDNCDRWYRNSNWFTKLRAFLHIMPPSLIFFNRGEYTVKGELNVKEVVFLRRVWHACDWLIDEIEPLLPHNGAIHVTIDSFDSSRVRRVQEGVQYINATK